MLGKWGISSNLNSTSFFILIKLLILASLFNCFSSMVSLLVASILKVREFFCSPNFEFKFYILTKYKIFTQLVHLLEMWDNFLIFIFPVCINLQSVERGAYTDVQRQHSRNHACFSVKNAVRSAFVCLQEPMETSNFALATITGRPREEALNVLN